jgi:hypothetical protein
MATSPNDNPEQRPGFPFLTAAATLVTLFAFVGLMWLAYHRPDPLGPPTPTAEPGEAKAAPDLNEIKARNEAALGGVGAKMSREEARAKLLANLKGPNDKLPFPAPEPPAPPAPKKDEKKAEPKGKAEEKKQDGVKKDEEK